MAIPLLVGLATAARALLPRVAAAAVPIARQIVSKAAAAAPAAIKWLTSYKGIAAQAVVGGALSSQTIRTKIKDIVTKEPLAPLVVTPLAPIVYGKQVGKAIEIAKTPELSNIEKVKRVAENVVGPIGIGAAAALLAAPVVKPAAAAIGGIALGKAIDSKEPKVMESPAGSLPIGVTESTSLKSISGDIPTQDSKIYKQVTPSVRITNRPQIQVNTRITNKNGGNHYNRQCRVIKRCSRKA